LKVKLNALFCGFLLPTFLLSGFFSLAPNSSRLAHQSVGEEPRVSAGSTIYEQTPTPQLPVLAEEDVAQFLPAASQFTHPDKRPTIVSFYNAQTLITNPSNYDGYHVELGGKILNIHRFSEKAIVSWKNGYVITFDDGSALIPVIYRGSLYQLANGINAQISGMFVADGSVIHADMVSADLPKTPWYTGLPPGMLPIGLSAILLGLIAVLLLILPKKIFISVILLWVMLGLSGCEIHIENHIKPNGRITTSIQIVETEENIDFFRKIPGLDRYLSSWIARSREEGSLVENWVEEKNEFFYIQNSYLDFQSFMAMPEDQFEEDSHSWVYVNAYPVGDEICYRYLAQVSADMLYVTPPDTEQRIITEVHKLIDDIDLTYAVTLPGRLLFSNGSAQSSSTAQWELSVRDNNELVAESCYFPPSFHFDWIWVWTAIAGIGMMDVGLWLLVIRKFSIKPVVPSGDQRR
jgi:hypothetical protein